MFELEDLNFENVDWDKIEAQALADQNLRGFAEKKPKPQTAVHSGFEGVDWDEIEAQALADQNTRALERLHDTIIQRISVIETEGKGKLEKCKYCKSSKVVTLVAKTLLNNGRSFTKCKSCEKFLSWKDKKEKHTSGAAHTKASLYDGRKSAIGLCIQFDGEESDKIMMISQGFMIFLLATLRNNSSASYLRGLESMRREIYSYLIDKKKSRIVGQSFCTRVLCMFPRCSNTICTEHGWGDAFQEGISRSVYSYYTYDSRSCAVNGCKNYYCFSHQNHPSFTECNVCSNNMYAYVSMGCCDENTRSCESKLCFQHEAVYCGRTIDEEQRCDKDEDEDDIGEDGDGDGEGSGEKCDFACCSNCLYDHRCGDDPHEYM